MAAVRVARPEHLGAQTLARLEAAAGRLQLRASAGNTANEGVNVSLALLPSAAAISRPPAGRRSRAEKRSAAARCAT